ncbi:GerMN domain-containing protein [Pseudoclavibacter sp. 13-3]|uniref:GerMN domain-containing protein n=1 Tax=Pseudoclavibacter sp. 13-3 TaxID=2901228 RepID=UPI001E2AF758|nr:GerMN domain-containing protein [Pseudoclavibacter sp. 13-3]MCD7102355.1 LpqB family beta-propeller domain-containing protein [Pseudoclavibacter sp. 13-3]
MTRGSKRALAGLLAAVLLPVGLVLGGCVRLPDSGVPQRVVDSGGSTNSSGYVVNASGPADGASPTEIINGFILASADTRGSHSVAREFLTDGLAASWQPDAQVQVLDSMPDLDDHDVGHVAATGALQATVDAVGVYRDQTSRLNQEYSLVQVNGQWRISAAPDGVLMTRASFDLVFRPARLAYLSTAGDTLVPDVRWFQAGDQTATRLVKAFLAGPVPTVQAGAQQLISSDLHLAVEAVGVSSGVASISLSGEFLSLDELHQRQVKTLLVRSLEQVDDIQEVSLTVNNLRIDLPTIPTADMDFPHAQNGVVLGAEGESLQAMDGQSWQSVDPLPSELQPIRSALTDTPVSALSVARGRLAAGAADGMHYMGGDQTPHVLTGTTSGIASIDVVGTAWTLRDGQIVWVDADSGVSNPMPLPAEAAGAGAVVAAAVAPDGARIGVAVAEGQNVRLLAFGVHRDAAGHPAELTAATEVGRTSGAVTALTWNADDQVAAALAPTTATGESTIVVRSLSGSGSQTTVHGRVTQLVGAPHDGQLRAVSDGRLFAVQSGSVTELGVRVSALTTIWH